MNKEDCKRVFVEKYKIYRTKKKNDYENALNFGVYLGMRDMMIRSGLFTLEEINDIEKSISNQKAVSA